MDVMLSVLFVIQQIYRKIAYPHFLKLDGRAKEKGLLKNLGHAGVMGEPVQLCQ